MLESTVMLKKLSVMKPPKERSSALKRGGEDHSGGLTKVEGLFLSEEDMKEEQPLMFEGQPVNHFDDLLKHVKFDISEIMPCYKVTEEEFDPVLEAEINRIRKRNHDTIGPVSLEEGSPPLGNLILLTKIDEFLNHSEYLDNSLAAVNARRPY